MCNPAASCVLCANPPVLMVYFHQQAWESALATHNQKHIYTTLTLLDPYSEKYAKVLRDANDNAFRHYVNLCHSVHLELLLRNLSGMCTTIATIDTAVHPNTDVSGRVSLAIYTPPDEGAAELKRAALTGFAEERPLKKTRRLVTPNARALKTKTAEDFESVSVQPLGDTKLESEKCFTCIQLGRSCSGIKMIDGRCEMCATKTGNSGSRKCYWRKPGIDTYEAAKKADTGAVYNEKNTRAGRTKRAYDRSVEDGKEDIESEQQADEETSQMDHEIVTSKYFRNRQPSRKWHEYLSSTGNGGDIMREDVVGEDLSEQHSVALNSFLGCWEGWISVPLWVWAAENVEFKQQELKLWDHPYEPYTYMRRNLLQRHDEYILQL